LEERQHCPVDQPRARTEREPSVFWLFFSDSPIG
jgi:hypothetical protein